MAELKDNLYYEKLVQAVAGALEAAEVTPEEIGRFRKLGGYQGQAKDADDNIVISDMFKWELSSVFETGPAWPVIDKVAPIKVPRVNYTIDVDAEIETTLVIPDCHFGATLVDGTFMPMQDEAAISLYTQIAQELRPHRVVYLGDNLDLPDYSQKFARSPTMAGHMNYTLEKLYGFLSQMRSATHKDCKHDYIEGNHESRVVSLILANAEAAFGVKRVGEDWPAMSIPYLLRFDELNIEWHGAYPQGTVWLRPDLRCVHGRALDSTKASKTGLTVSQVQGHSHRMGLKSRTFTGPSGAPIQTLFAEAGTGARIDGAVPSFGSATDSRGVPKIGNNAEDWQQGCIILEYKKESTDLPSVEFVTFSEGRTLFRGSPLDGVSV